MIDWISVEDRLPPLDKRVIAFGGYYGAGSAHYTADFDGNDYWQCHFVLPTTNKYVEVTHWMPLPEPPTEQERSDG